MSTPPPDLFARSGSLRLRDHLALTPQGVLRGVQLDYESDDRHRCG